ncbi:Por secretion system C-terminal sorting domain-containing protein [Lishizhenia tianjinensis]|uniref:Por secretion system C-terminal sorting domain-containing protein n=1 Tax=Lishizhenia tianjinensis TaxID=477690 RepID=A0A1I6XZZ4_9FLAO|nr:T9SS type A sorting domain-containing protein [Lishizhenia tianjinensis]SFT43925.1 Por secretion system C-terminal sorting domain-containing protein [Lishizhenia tianjinensis]
MKKHLYLFLILFVSIISRANWSPVSTGINDHFNGVILWDTLAVLIGNQGIYCNTQVDSSPSSFNRFVMNNSDSLLYNNMQFKDMIELSSGEVMIAANDTVIHQAMLFRFNATNNTYSFTYTSPVNHSFNGIGKFGLDLFAVGDNGFIVEYDGLSSTVLNLNLSYIDLNDFVSSSTTYLIVADGYYFKSNLAPSAASPNVFFLPDNLKSSTFYNSSQFMLGGQNFYHSSTLPNSNSYHNYGDLNLKEMIRVGSKVFLATDHGVFNVLNTSSTANIEYQPSSLATNLNGIYYDNFGSQLMACGNNGALLYSSTTSIAQEPYVKITHNYECEGLNTPLRAQVGSSSSCSWYMDNVLVANTCGIYYPNGSNLTASTVSLVVSNAYFSDSTSAPYYYIDSADIDVPITYVDTILCRVGEIQLEVQNSEIDRTYSLEKLGSFSPLTPVVQGTGGSISLETDSLTDTGPYHINIGSVYGSCRWYQRDTFTVKIQDPKSFIHANKTNVEINETVQYYAQSTEATNFLWTFPTNASITTSNLEAPVVTYNSLSTPSLSLVSWTNEMCYDTATLIGPTVFNNPSLSNPCYIDTFNTNISTSPDSPFLAKLKNAQEGYFAIYRTYKEGIYSRNGTQKFNSEPGEYLVKYDDDDNMKWFVRQGTNSNNDISYQMMVEEAPNGDIYLAGSGGTYSYFYDNTGDSIFVHSGAYLIRLDSLGKIIWYNLVEPYGAYIRGLAVDNNGEAVISFATNDVIDVYINHNGTIIDTIPILPSTYYNIEGQIIKFDSNGAMKHRILHSNYYIDHISFDAQNRMYLIHNSGIENLIDNSSNSHNISWPNIPGNLVSSGVTIVCLDTASNYLWDFKTHDVNASASGIRLHDFHQEENGDLFLIMDNDVFGGNSSQLIYDSQDSVTTYTSGSFCFMKINGDGKMMWINGMTDTPVINDMYLEREKNSDTLYLISTGRLNNAPYNSPIRHINLASRGSIPVKFPMLRNTYFHAKYDTSGVLYTVNTSTSQNTPMIEEFNSDIVLKEDGFRHFKVINTSINYLPFTYSSFGGNIHVNEMNLEYFEHYDTECGTTYCPGYSLQTTDTVCIYGSYTYLDGHTVDSITTPGLYKGYYPVPNSNCHGDFQTYLYINTDNDVDAYDTVCIGDSYIFPDQTSVNNILSDFTQISTLYNSLGCDSTINTHIEVLQDIDLGTSVTGDSLYYNFPLFNYSYQWLECENNTYTAIPGATNSYYIAPANGSYSLSISNGYCSDTIACIDMDDLKIEDIPSMAVDIYPNPSTGEFNVQTLQGEYQLELLSINGELLRSYAVKEEKFVLDLSGYAKGVYFIRIDQKVYKIILK